jgi:hypothetical protein
MNLVMILAAQVPEALPELTPTSRPVGSDITLVLFAIGALVAVIFLWVVFIRGPKKHPDEANRKPLGVTAKPAVTVTDDGRERHRKKKRMRRRDHRDRNPTLAQTGGLPPPRDPQQITPI